MFSKPPATSCSLLLQDAIVTARTEPQLGDGVLHDLFALCGQHTVLADMPRTHLRVGVDLFVVEAAELNAARGNHACTDGFRGFCGPRVGEFLVRNGRHIDLDIDAIHQRARNFRHVALNLRRRTETFASKIVCKSARASLRCPFAIGY